MCGKMWNMDSKGKVPGLQVFDTSGRPVGIEAFSDAHLRADIAEMRRRITVLNEIAGDLRVAMEQAMSLRLNFVGAQIFKTIEKLLLQDVPDFRAVAMGLEMELERRGGRDGN